MNLTATEVLLILTNIGAGFKWWQERKDTRSNLSTAMSESEKTVRTLREALASKNEELETKDRLIDRYLRRIEHLESLLVSR
jgi:uncharacterized protein (DUF2461 family)